jgi:coiled-coil domain-containing protein 77
MNLVRVLAPTLLPPSRTGAHRRLQEMEAHPPLPEAGQALLDVPMSPELMNYYRERLAASEHEIVGLRERVETCETSQAAQHKQRWELHKRMEEITDLQKALSDSHVYLWDERERCQRLQAENDELKIQEVEDRRKIQHLLSMVEPVMQDVTYLRDGAPETMTLHAHARATTTSAPASRSVRASGGARGGVSGGGGTGGGGHAGAPARPAVPVMNPGEGPRVLRTVYLPNEKVDSLLLTIESLRAQLQQQEQLGRERVAALHEDRRLRIEEVRGAAPWQRRLNHPLACHDPPPHRALAAR